jgi:hypothetical protein
MSGNGMSSPVVLVRTLQIIVAALVVGCSIFLAIVFVIAAGSSKVPDPPLFTYIALAFAAGAVGARLIIPRIFAAQARRKILAGTWGVVGGNSPASDTGPAEHDDASKLAQVLMARTILAAAILEGAAFLLLIAHLVEHSPLSLAAAIVLIVVLAAHVPTQSRVDRWIEDQTRLLNEERQLAG